MTDHDDPAVQVPGKEPSGAARQFGGFAPGLVGFTDDVLFGQVWTRPELSPRDRSAAAATQANCGPAPVRRFLPDLISRIESRSIDPGKVFDLTLPLDQAAEGYRAMDERRAIKTLLRP